MVEALQRRFSQETNTNIELQELAGFKRGKNQTVKELADTAQWLVSHAYYLNDYTSQEKAALHAFQTAAGEDFQLKCAERGCRGRRQTDQSGSDGRETEHSSMKEQSSLDEAIQTRRHLFAT